MLANTKHFQRTRVYQNSVSIPNLRKDIGKIAELDYRSELEQKRTEKIAGIGVLVAIVSLFLGISLALALAHIFPLLGATCLVAIVGGSIVGYTYFQKSRKAAFLNFAERRDRYELLEQLSEFLKKDSSHQDKLKVTLVMSPPDTPEKLLKEEPLLKRKDGKIKQYRDPYLKIKGKLLDGNKFYLQITERYQIRTWTNVNRKHRIRPRAKGFDILLVFSFSQDDYVIPNPLKSDLEKVVKLPATVIYKKRQMQPGKLRLKVKVPPLSSLENRQSLLMQTIEMMFLSGYQILNLARMVTLNEKV